MIRIRVIFQSRAVPSGLKLTLRWSVGDFAWRRDGWARPSTPTIRTISLLQPACRVGLAMATLSLADELSLAPLNAAADL
jgi:hypothetical protein